MVAPPVIKVGTHTNRRFIELDGKTYVQDDMRDRNQRSRTKATTSVTFREVDLKDYDRLIDSLASRLVKKTDTKQILVQALRDMPLTDLERIRKELDKPKPRIRNQKGCAELVVGGIKLGLRD